MTEKELAHIRETLETANRITGFLDELAKWDGFYSSFTKIEQRGSSVWESNNFRHEIITAGVKALRLEKEAELAALSFTPPAAPGASATGQGSNSASLAH